MLIHNKCHNKTEIALGFVFRDTVTFIRRILTVTEDPCYIISSTSKFFNACRHFTGRNWIRIIPVKSGKQYENWCFDSI